MAEQPAVSENVTPEQFFAELLPAGFLAQKESNIPTPQDFTIRYHLTGAGGGEWHVTIKDGKMTVDDVDTELTDVTGDQSAVKDCVKSKAASVSLDATGQPDVDHYAITMPMRVTS